MAKIAPKGKKVVGTKKKDKITWVSTKPWKKNLTVKAGAGNDVINFKKSKYKNTIYGEAGADKIYGGKGADKIYGGKGNDTISAGKGNNTLYFSKGDGTDTVLKGGGTDTLVFKTEKSLSGIKAAYSGNNAIITYNGGKVVLKDYKLGGHSAKYVKVGSTKKSIADLLKPPSPIVDGYYVINGTSGNDSITAKDGYDCKISGGAGNDTITGGAGNDQIYGGAGNDEINAGVGNNTIYIGKNEGTDTIQDGGGTDTLILNDGIDFRALSFAYDGNDLKISAEGTTAILKNQKTGGSSVKYIKSGNETIELPQDIIITDETAELWQSHDNLFVYSEGVGTAAYTGFGNDTVFASQSGVTSVYTHGGDDIIVGSDYPYEVGGHLYYGGEGNDTIYVGKAGANVVMQRGNDVINTPDTDNSAIVSNYIFNENFGNATIYWRGNTVNNLLFNNGTVSYDNITFFRNPENNDLLLSAPGNNRVTIKDYFKTGNGAMATSFKLKTSGADYLDFGTVVSEKGISNFTYGTDNDDELEIENGNTYLFTKLGNDSIDVVSGLNTIESGAGYDVINVLSSNNVVYADDDDDEITVKNNSSYTVIEAGAGNDNITVQYGSSYTAINGDKGSDYILAYGRSTIYGGNGFDVIHAYGESTIYGGKDSIGTDDSDNIIDATSSGYHYIIGGNQKDTINVGHDRSGDNIIYGRAGDDSINAAGAANATIDGGEGNDSIYAAYISGTIEGGAGDDYIEAEYGNHTIDGGEGNDKIYGGYGNNTIIGGYDNDSIYSGEGNATINGGEGTDYIDVTKGTNTIIFDDVKPNWSQDNNLIETVSGFKNSDTIQITTTQDGWHGMAPMFFDSKTKDLYLGVQGSGTYNIKITDYSNETRNGLISIDGADAIRMSEFLTQNQMYLHTDEVDNLSDISGGTHYMLGGNDVVTGNVREDSYSGIYIYAGDGNDSITGIGADYTYIYGEDGNDTISTDTYAISNGFIYGGAGDDEITANDQKVKATLSGDEGNDKLIGGHYMDGGTGNDTIISSATGDTEYSNNATYISGGEGNDEIHVYNTHYNPVVYNFYLNQSDGNDVIYDDLVDMRQIRFMQRSQDKSFLDMVNEIRYAKNGNDLIIKYKDNNSDLYRNSITIKNYMISENQTNLRYVDNYGDYQLVKTFIDTHGIELNGTDGDDVIYGSANADAIYAGDGDDFIYAGRGNDRIHTGAGNNTMVFYNRYYFDGSNKYDNANDGNDIVYTNGGGADTLDFGQSIAVKYEKSDNDLIIKYNFDPASYWEAKSTVTLKDFYDNTVNNSTQYIKLLGQDAIELKPDELTQDAITTHNGSILCSSNSSDMRFNDNNNYRTAIGSNGDNIIIVYSTASETYYLDGKLGNDVYEIDSLNPKVIIYDSDNIGKVNVYTGSFTTNNNIFCDMQVTVKDGVVTACDYNSLNIYRTGQFDQGVRVMASPNLAGVTDGTPAQSISRVDDGGNSKKLTDISGLAQETANWIAANKADGIYSTAALVSAGGDDASAILAIANTYWQNY